MKEHVIELWYQSYVLKEVNKSLRSRIEKAYELERRFGCGRERRKGFIFVENMKELC